MSWETMRLRTFHKEDGDMRSRFVESKGVIYLSMVFVLLFSGMGYAQEDISKYPSKPITYVCPVPPGTGTDLSIRLIAKELEKVLGQPIVVVNKPGAALTIGTAFVAAAKPDGYTIGFSGGPPLFFTPLLEKVPYHLNDLRMIAQYGGFNFGVIVKGDSPFKTFKDLIDYARQNPKKMTYGTTGTNSMGHITMERIAKLENVQITHIPFKGTPESQTALLGGHILAAAGDFGVSLVESGQTRVVMMLKEEKSAEYPHVPILKEMGYDLPYPMIIGVITARAVPDGIVAKLDDAFFRAMKEPAFVKGMKELHLPVMYRSGKELDAYVARNYEYYSKLFKEMGLIR
jgi:tripartite-type tricarboxylate transporter receptor subunit TctC